MVFDMSLIKMMKVSFFIASLMVAGTVYAAEKEYRSPEQVDGTILTSAQQAKALFDRGEVFIDVRNPRLYAKGHIPGASPFDLKNNFDESKLGSVAKKDQPIIIYCSGVKCSRSYRASEKAVAWGFTRVHYFRGGIVDWKKAGFPVAVSEKEQEK